MQFGIDVSHHQGTINWQKVSAAGVSFAMLRAGFRGYGDGVIHQDKNINVNVEGCLDNNIPYGIYFFTQAINEAEAIEEAEFIIEFLQSHNYKPEYPVCIDQELSGASSRTGRADKLTSEQYKAVCAAFCSTLEKAGFYAMIYCSESWANNQLAGLTGTDFWIAKWGTVKPSIMRTYGIWQNSNSGAVDGISTRVDTNLVIASFSYPEVIKAKGMNGWKAPEPKIIPLWLRVVKVLFKLILVAIGGDDNDH